MPPSPAAARRFGPRWKPRAPHAFQAPAFRPYRGVEPAVADVSLTLRRGEILTVVGKILPVVGKNGSGKSTSAKLIRRTPLLILDGPTSQMDPRGECMAAWLAG
ncbi:hypothetical protein ACFWFI_30030 [Streptomyces sp. NPDC060209]|uniref:hypothetical protein n=1 Tax=Streptomyces sp. NPDC060209 TaxID=3347073 RepID=UPI00364C6A7E